MLRVVSVRHCGRVAAIAAALVAALGIGSVRAAERQAVALNADTLALPFLGKTEQRPGADTPSCRPPLSLCVPTLRELEQGAFLDFLVTGESEVPRLVSPFAVQRGDPLDRSRCPAKLCAAHLALSGLLEDLMKQGYHTQSVATFPGSAVVTLRSERIDLEMQPLKGRCRFNLDHGCRDSGVWLREDRASGEPCGFAQTRVFVAMEGTPDLVAGLDGPRPTMRTVRAGREALRTVALDMAGVKVYELVYVHKICRSHMSLVRNG
jgi:hypothetical protein